MGTTMVTPSFTPGAANAWARKMIQQTAVRKRIQLNSATFVPANTAIATFQLQNVGIVRGLTVKCVATVSNTDGANLATLSDFGAANMWSQIQFQDLSNITRIQTTGAHVFTLDSVRRQAIMGCAYANDNTGKFGANWTPVGLTGATSSTTIAHGTSGTLTSYHYVPLMYSDSPYNPDFRGSIFANITNASMQLNLTFNPLVSVPAGTDSVNAIFGGVATANVTITTATVTVYQDVYDQLPDYRLLPAGVTPQMWQAATGDRTGLLLPNIDQSWEYELKFSPFTGITANVENNLPYTNQRQFLSTLVQYENNSTRALGTDINYFRLVAANSYEWWKMDPLTVAFEFRRIMNDDIPAGFYWFDSRHAPINTVVSGNLNLIINPSTAVAAFCNVFTEDFAKVATITGASALASNI